jgi:hypothetical protein
VKVAFRVLPRSAKCELRMNKIDPARFPRVFFLKRGRTAAVLLVVITCILSVLAGAFTYWKSASSETQRPFIPAELVERSTVVRPVEDTQNLKPGDLVVLRPNALSKPTVQQVAVRPNETVVIRRGGAIDSLYMLGEKSGIVVASDAEPTRIVRPEQITGTLVIGSTNN